MATVARNEALQRPLHVVAAGGWFGGFGNLLRKELGQWWGTRAWWVQTVVCMLLLNGITTVALVTDMMPADEMRQELVRAYLSMSVMLAAIGTVIAAQGAIVSEKEMGTAAWVMSKPASRYAFILAKVVAYALSFGFSAMLIPSTIFLILSSQFLDAPLSLPLFLVGIGVVALALLFYLTLMLMLGTLFNSRGPIAAIGIAIVMAGLLLKGMIPMPVLMVTPWLLGDLAGGLALRMPLPPSWYVPLIATAVWTLLFTVVALWRFKREEF